MEQDLLLEGYLLYSDRTEIKTTNFITTNSLLTGAGLITGFAQINRTHLAFADYTQHCVRIFDRSSIPGGGLRVLSGQCGSYGFVDGDTGDAKFNFPHSIIKSSEAGKLLVTDWNNNALRSMDLATGDVSTIVRSGLHLPRSMTWYGDILLVANDHYIAAVSWNVDNTATAVVLAGGREHRGDMNGEFSTSLFYNPRDISRLTTNMFLVADYRNNKLRLLDMDRKQVLPVCVELSCKFDARVYSVISTSGGVFVGRDGSIIKLTGRFIEVTKHVITLFMSSKSVIF